MNMRNWFRITGRIAILGAAVPLVLRFSAFAAPLRIAGDDVKGAFKNEKVAVRGDTVVITFKLDAPADHTYRVGIKLRKRNEPGFGWELKKVEGDVGEGEFGQKSCRVNWLFKRELPEAELGEEFWFELTCELADQGIPWWVYVGGGTAAVVTTVLILGKGSHPPPPPDNTLPMPPGDWPLQKK